MFDTPDVRKSIMVSMFSKLTNLRIKDSLAVHRRNTNCLLRISKIELMKVLIVL